MDIGIIEGLIASIGFPITMVGFCGFFIWKMYQVQIQDKERLYTELGKSINANERFSEIITSHKLKLDDIHADVHDIKGRVFNDYNKSK